jgi:hypothetical protein
MADPSADAGATPAPDATSGEQTPTTSETTSRTPPADDLGDGGKRAIDALRRENRALQRERDALSQAQREREDSERTELERAQAKLSESEARISELEHEQRARAAASRHGIPDLWDRLKGSTPDELDDDAKSIAERMGPAENGGSSTTRPDLGGGPRPPAPARGSAAYRERRRPPAQGRR